MLSYNTNFGLCLFAGFNLSELLNEFSISPSAAIGKQYSIIKNRLHKLTLRHNDQLIFKICVKNCQKMPFVLLYLKIRQMSATIIYSSQEFDDVI